MFWVFFQTPAGTNARTRARRRRLPAKERRLGKPLSLSIERNATLLSVCAVEIKGFGLYVTFFRHRSRCCSHHNILVVQRQKGSFHFELAPSRKTAETLFSPSFFLSFFLSLSCHCCLSDSCLLFCETFLSAFAPSSIFSRGVGREREGRISSG
jgi:hypothetical protein